MKRAGSASLAVAAGAAALSVPMGGWPSNVTVNPVTGTVYIPDNVDGQVSFFSR
jgi:DNA-binding beta-propeller fold protein YncE